MRNPWTIYSAFLKWEIPFRWGKILQHINTMYTVFQNEWDNYNLHYWINWSSCNNEITWYKQTNTSSFPVKWEREATCENFINQYENETLDMYLVFSDEATFHQCGITGRQTECVSFETFTAVMFQLKVFWVMTLCSVVVGYQCFRGLCCLHLQGHGVTTQRTLTWNRMCMTHQKWSCFLHFPLLYTFFTGCT
jgi:hypothetical protein